MKKAIITVGISGSGKSTFARELEIQGIINEEEWLEINRDNIRFNYKTPDWTKYKFTRDRENRVTQEQEDMLCRADEHNLNVIISDTNLNPKTRDKWITLLESLQYEVEIKEFPITWEEAIKRNVQREGGVTPTVLHKQWRQWLQYLESKGEHKCYKPNWANPLVFICDIDGTVAQMKGRHPYEWDKVGQDEVRHQMLATVQGLVDQGYTPIYLSGRDGICWYETLTWLEDNGFPVDEKHFFIRQQGDSRKDTVIKQEIFWNHIADNFNVQIVIDDRPCVVSTWYDINIPCVMAVADQRNWF